MRNRVFLAQRSGTPHNIDSVTIKHVAGTTSHIYASNSGSDVPIPLAPDWLLAKRTPTIGALTLTMKETLK